MGEDTPPTTMAPVSDSKRPRGVPGSDVDGHQPSKSARADSVPDEEFEVICKAVGWELSVAKTALLNDYSDEIHKMREKGEIDMQFIHNLPKVNELIEPDACLLMENLCDIMEHGSDGTVFLCCLAITYAFAVQPQYVFESDVIQLLDTLQKDKFERACSWLWPVLTTRMIAEAMHFDEDMFELINGLENEEGPNSFLYFESIIGIACTIRELPHLVEVKHLRKLMRLLGEESHERARRLLWPLLTRDVLEGIDFDENKWPEEREMHMLVSLVVLRIKSDTMKFGMEKIAEHVFSAWRP